MNVAVTGSSGLIGSTLGSALAGAGHTVRRFVRSRPTDEGQVRWDPASGRLDSSALDEVDAIVHLSGETVAGRWSDAKKRRIRESRIGSTQLLSQTIAKLPSRPAVLVSASAIGYYGDRGDEWLNEDSPPGSGFLADVVRDWEAATASAASAGVRVVNTRFGLVLSARGGLLRQLLTPFRLGLGGRLGSGAQYMSWIAIDDVVAAIMHALAHAQVTGPLNIVAPNPVTNREFTKALGAVLHRPTLMAVPAFAMKAAVGEFSAEALGSQRVRAAKLERSGYDFAFAQLEPALRHLLDRPA
ncbi:MAG: TIGR01777 family oxidoreductase [Solirubrobacterales bacterium]